MRVLKTLIYTSRAADAVGAPELERIHRSAMTLNSLDGVTGLLLFNGTSFLQLLEGAPDAIDDLMGRLRVDPRHGDIVVHEESVADARSFPDWSMELVVISAGRFEARRDIERMLPTNASASARQLLLDMVDYISI